MPDAPGLEALAVIRISELKPVFPDSTTLRTFDILSLSCQKIAMIVSKWRKLLIVVAITVAIFDVWFLAVRSDHDADQISANWVAYMPALEERQRRDLAQLLYSSHHWDPAYPQTYVIEGGRPYPLFSKIAHSCVVREYAISQFVGPTSEVGAFQMPDRLFLGALDATQVKCLREALPEGYVLAKLSEEIAPSEVGWAEGDLDLAPNGP